MIWTEQGLDALRLFEGLVQAMEGMLNQPAMTPVPILKVPMQGTDMLTGAKPSGPVSKYLHPRAPLLRDFMALFSACLQYVARPMSPL